MLRMDQVHVIRHKVLLEGKSVRSVAKEMGVSRNTVAPSISRTLSPGGAWWRASKSVPL
jgi:transposase